LIAEFFKLTDGSELLADAGLLEDCVCGVTRLYLSIHPSRSDR
jgi:hypothetical protein